MGGYKIKTQFNGEKMKKMDGSYTQYAYSDDTDFKLEVIERKDVENKNKPLKRVRTAMLSRNINVLGHRTSIRLEKEMWEALKQISDRESCSVHDICTLVHLRKREDTSLTAAIRVFVMLYFKAACTEEGHDIAGHGNF